MKKNRGITIVELIGFIIVLGIIIVLVIPKITEYITGSREKTMVQNAEIYLESAKVLYHSQYMLPEAGQTDALSVCDIRVRSGGKSPYGAEWDCEKSFVAVYNPDNNQYNYYVQLVDANGNALPLTEEGHFHEDLVVVESDGNYPTRSDDRLLIMRAKVGDYVNYDAGVWETDMALPTQVGTIGGVMAGTSRNNSVSCSDVTSILSGWRILSKRDGKVTLVSAGNPLCYYHGGTDNAYTSEQYLKGNLDWASKYVSSKATSEVDALSFEDFKNEFALSVSVLGKEDLLNYCKDTSNCEMNEDSEGAIANVSDASLFRIDAPYYLASSKDTATLWSVATDGNITSFTDQAQGIRILITLNSDVVAKGKDENGAWILS